MWCVSWSLKWTPQNERQHQPMIPSARAELLALNIATRYRTLLKSYMRMIGGEQYEKRNARGEGCGKDAPWKSPKADFSTSLGNPAKNAGFPLFTQPRLLLDTLSLVDSLVPTQTGGIGSLYHRP